MAGKGVKRKIHPPAKQTQTKNSCSSVIKQNVPEDICAKHGILDEECSSIQNKLLMWYDKEQRVLPWRDIAKNEKNANVRGYAVWVSEVMLQQTQVATVIPYFNNWIKKWPNVESLASAKLEEVLQLWAGLGYYSRGRRLHEGANIVMEKLDGRIPDSVEELAKEIPGIGAYSASAIASVAFQKVAGVVDGNVIRVLSRMRVIGSNITRPGVRDHLWKLANAVVSRERPGDFNQALMELGAVVCTPQNPNCSKCPVSDHCLAYAHVKKSTQTSQINSFLVEKKYTKKKPEPEANPIEVPDIENVPGCQFCLPSSVWEKNPQVTVFPCKVEKKAARDEKVYVVVIENSEQFLMVRRPEKGLLAGLWEFPSAVLPESNDDFSKSSLMEPLLIELGLPPFIFAERKHIGEVIHLFSHIHTTYVIDHIVMKNDRIVQKTAKEIMWTTEEEMKSAAISTAMKKVLALVKKTETFTQKQVSGLKRKRTPDSKQPSIKSFFS